MSLAEEYMSNARSSKTKSKVEAYGWTALDKPGRFAWIDKNDLNIASSKFACDGKFYQRDPEAPRSKNRVLKIARNFTWFLCGTILVVMRSDGSYWVVDGGHRVTAARKRADIKQLPSMVFDLSGSDEDYLAKEAKIFIDANTARYPMSPFNLHKAKLTKGDMTAIEMDRILSKHGYTASDDGGSPYQFKAISTFTKMVAENSDIADKIFHICTKICPDGDTIPRPILSAIYKCYQWYGIKILSGYWMNKMITLGGQTIDKAIKTEKALLGIGGERVEGIALVKQLNKGKRSGKLSIPEDV